MITRDEYLKVAITLCASVGLPEHLPGITTKEEAESALRELARFYREPVLPVSKGRGWKEADCRHTQRTGKATSLVRRDIDHSGYPRYKCKNCLEIISVDNLE